jgi:predicted DNA-binding transcriptional regulator YafY
MWRLTPTARRRTLTMTLRQILSLELARQALSYLQGTELHRELTTIISRVREGLAPEDQTALDTLGRKIAVVHSGPKSYGNKLQVLEDILGCLLCDELLELSYRPPKARVRTHLVEPYTLVIHAESLYLLALSRTRSEHRTFAVDRIVATHRRRGQRFDYPDDHTPAQMLDGAFGIIGGEPVEVELLFDAEHAPYVMERQWHPTQQVEWLAGGGARLSMRVASTMELMQWLVGRIDGCEIVQPPSLRRRAATLLRRALERHRKTPQ